MCPNLAYWCFQSCMCQGQSSRVDALHSQWSNHWHVPLYPPGLWQCCHPCMPWRYEDDHPTLSSTCSCDETKMYKRTMFLIFKTLYRTVVLGGGHKMWSFSDHRGFKTSVFFPLVLITDAINYLNYYIINVQCRWDFSWLSQEQNGEKQWKKEFNKLLLHFLLFSRA